MLSKILVMTFAITWSPIVNFLFLFFVFFFTCLEQWGCFATLVCGVSNLIEGGFAKRSVKDNLFIIVKHIHLLMLQLHPLIYTIWHTSNSSNTTKNVIGR